MQKTTLIILTSNFLLGISGASLAQETIILSGPMSTSKDPSTIEILGAKTHVSATAVAYVDGVYYGNARDALQRVGDRGNANASAVSDTAGGDAAEFRIDTKSEYAAGASQVILMGPVDLVNERLARIAVRGVQVSYVDALSENPTLGFIPGEMVRVVGTQPTPNGQVLATRITKATKPGISGSGITATPTSGPQAPGISGSGIVPQRKTTAFTPLKTAVVAQKGISGSGISPQPISNPSH
jgi:hypothetical protein